VVTTSGVSAVARVLSCSRIASLRPTPSAGAPIILLAQPAQPGQSVPSGGAVIGWRWVKSEQPCAQRNVSVGIAKP
jgi:hypothetical protein